MSGITLDEIENQLLSTGEVAPVTNQRILALIDALASTQTDLSDLEARVATLEAAKHRAELVTALPDSAEAGHLIRLAGSSSLYVGTGTGSPLIWYPHGGQIKTAGQASETDTAQPVSNRRFHIGIAEETNMPQIIRRFPGPVVDNFNRADEDPAAGWASLEGSYGRRLKVVSNTGAYGATVDPNVPWMADYWTATTYGPNVAAGVTLSTLGAVDDSYGIILRAGNPGFGLWEGYLLTVIVLSGSNTEWQIHRVVARINGQERETWGASQTHTISAAGAKIAFEATGNQLIGWVNTSGTWTQVISRTDSNNTYMNAGHIGLFGEGTTARLDDFSGGTL